MNIKQQTQQIDFSGHFEQLFDILYEHYDSDQIFMMDSASGPSVDRQNNIIGLFPQLDILIKGETLEIRSEDKNLESLIKTKLSDFFDKGSKSYILPEDVRFSEIFSRIKSVFEVTSSSNKPIPSFTNGLVGYFGYEYLHHIEKVERNAAIEDTIPDVHLCYYSCLLHFTEKNSQISLFSNNINQRAQQCFENLLTIFSSTDHCKQLVQPHFNFTNESDDKLEKFQVFETKENYFKKVAKAKQYIKAGDIFQVQLGFRFSARMNLNIKNTYKALRESSPSPYMFLWKRDNVSLIGNSPELQLKIQSGDITIRPIAGTSKGKGTVETREKVIKMLSESPKENAEHVMLVDLARNDVGRVSKVGTVNVEKLMDIEEYSNVFHLTSTVTGELLDNIDSMVAFEDTFPAGTLTGAPKIRAMEIIKEIEDYERGPYGGAFGFFDFNGDLVSSITIRTIITQNDIVFFQASAGIVADSVPEDEWNEVLFKTQTLRKIINSIEDPRFNLSLER